MTSESMETKHKKHSDSRPLIIRDAARLACAVTFAGCIIALGEVFFTTVTGSTDPSADRVQEARATLERYGFDSECFALRLPISDVSRCVEPKNCVVADSVCDDSPDLFVHSTALSWNLCSKTREKLTQEQIATLNVASKAAQRKLGYSAEQLFFDFEENDVTVILTGSLLDVTASLPKDPRMPRESVSVWIDRETLKVINVYQGGARRE